LNRNLIAVTRQSLRDLEVLLSPEFLSKHTPHASLEHALQTSGVRVGIDSMTTARLKLEANLCRGGRFRDWDDLMSAAIIEFVASIVPFS
jgi:hypothetical protein